jgi:hypothetical protein
MSLYAIHHILINILGIYLILIANTLAVAHLRHCESFCSDISHFAKALFSVASKAIILLFLVLDMGCKWYLNCALWVKVAQSGSNKSIYGAIS